MGPVPSGSISQYGDLVISSERRTKLILLVALYFYFFIVYSFDKTKNYMRVNFDHRYMYYYNLCCIWFQILSVSNFTGFSLRLLYFIAERYSTPLSCNRGAAASYPPELRFGNFQLICALKIYSNRLICVASLIIGGCIFIYLSLRNYFLLKSVNMNLLLQYAPQLS